MASNFLKWLKLLALIATSFADGKITKEEAAAIANLIVSLIYEEIEG